MIRSALVIGGGIAGPVAAMALQKAGIDAVVYEAYPSRAGDVGGGLTLAPNGLDALDVIGMGDLVRPAGTPTTGIVMQDWKGKRLGEFGNPPGVPPMQFFYRRDLYRLLYEEAGRRGIRIEHGKRLVSATETADGVTARFEDGTEATGDILIGADGIRSAVRRIIDANAPDPTYTGLIKLRRPGRQPRPALHRGQDADELRQARLLRLPGGRRDLGDLVREPAACAAALRRPGAADAGVGVAGPARIEVRRGSTPAAQLISRTTRQTC